MLNRHRNLIIAITLIIVGVFAIPRIILAYDYNSTDAESEGDIKISKEVKRIGKDDSYHDKVEIRSGALVEVWIQVKNTSSKFNATVTVRDELGGNIAYVQNSLRVNSQSAKPGLTSGGIVLNMPPKSEMEITYQMNVCGNGGYPMRAYAFAPGVGAATDAIIIESETLNFGGFDNTYNCLSQFESSTAEYTHNNADPFGSWTGVNNLSSTANLNSASANNPFAGWTGVDNSQNSFDSENIFGNWYGVNNSETVSNPFGDWYGSSASSSNNSANVFGNWYGIDSQGYQSSNLAYNESGLKSQENYYATSKPEPYRVAPITGVEKYTPFAFAMFLVAGVFIYRNRKTIFA